MPSSGPSTYGIAFPMLPGETGRAAAERTKEYALRSRALAEDADHITLGPLHYEVDVMRHVIEYTAEVVCRAAVSPDA